MQFRDVKVGEHYAYIPYTVRYGVTATRDLARVKILRIADDVPDPSGPRWRPTVRGFEARVIKRSPFSPPARSKILVPARRLVHTWAEQERRQAIWDDDARKRAAAKKRALVEICTMRATLAVMGLVGKDGYEWERDTTYDYTVPPVGHPEFGLSFAELRMIVFRAYARGTARGELADAVADLNDPGPFHIEPRDRMDRFSGTTRRGSHLSGKRRAYHVITYDGIPVSPGFTSKDEMEDIKSYLLTGELPPDGVSELNAPVAVIEVVS